MATVRAPELHGAGGWIGAADDVSLAALRGRLVLLDFWTLACVNCIHVVEELRELERRYADVLTVIGVHSPKFAHERSHDAVRAAVAARRVEHPVLDDPGLVTWDAYAVRAWPTLVLVGADGREAGRWAGEGHQGEIAVAIERELARATAAGELGAPSPRQAGAAAPILWEQPLPRPDEDAVTSVRQMHGSGELSFPGKVAVDAADPARPRLAIADSGHDRVLVCTVDGEVLHELGGLYQPQGVRWDSGDALLVCEQGAGRVWRIGLGGARELVADGLSSPWDVVRWHGIVTIAEAGRHRIRMVDADGEAQIVAGTGGENLVDGPALSALLAQPSGLAVTMHEELAFADAEASALRVLDVPGGSVRTLVGTGLFAWGDEDGDAVTARLQHPLGVARGPAGVLYVADTFNGLIRVFRGTHLWTLPVQGFREPGGLDVLPDGRLVVADTGNHRIVLVDPDSGDAAAIDVGRPGSVDAAAPVVAETLVLQAGATLDVELDLDLGGETLDRAAGAPVQLVATATDDALLAGPVVLRLDALPARASLQLGHGSGRITVELRAATCDEHVCRLRRTQRAYDLILT